MNNQRKVKEMKSKTTDAEADGIAYLEAHMKDGGAWLEEKDPPQAKPVIKGLLRQNNTLAISCKDFDERYSFFAHIAYCVINGSELFGIKTFAKNTGLDSASTAEQVCLEESLDWCIRKGLEVAFYFFPDGFPCNHEQERKVLDGIRRFRENGIAFVACFQQWEDATRARDCLPCTSGNLESFFDTIFHITGKGNLKKRNLEIVSRFSRDLNITISAKEMRGVRESGFKLRQECILENTKDVFEQELEKAVGDVADVIIQLKDAEE